MEITWISKRARLAARLAAELGEAAQRPVEIGGLAAAGVHPAVAEARRAAQRGVGVAADQDRDRRAAAPGRA